MSQTTWARWASRQFLTLPIVQTLLPVTFGYSLSSQYVVMRQCEDGHWPTHTRGLRWGLPEVVETVQQVHCNRRRLLRRWLEFHVCTINKSAHTKCRETYRMHLVYIYSKLEFIADNNLCTKPSGQDQILITNYTGWKLKTEFYVLNPQLTCRNGVTGGS